MVRSLAPARGEWGRLRILLAGLLAASAALLVEQRPSLGLGGAEVEAAGPSCRTRVPETMTIPLADLGLLKAQVAGTVPDRVGRGYEGGSVAAGNLWSDDHPVNGGSTSERVAAGYEQRWWALDRHGGEDDVVADVWEFSTPARAREAFALAVDPSCRSVERKAPGTRVGMPPGAQDIAWTNPDGVREWDSLLVRGRRLFRVADVPAGGGLASESGALAAVTTRTVNALACALPGAGCEGASAALADSALAVGTANAIEPGAHAAPTRASAAAFAHAVQIEPRDMPGFLPAQAARRSEQRTAPTAEGCGTETQPGSVLASASSRSYVRRRRGQYEWVASAVTVLGGEALASSYVALLGSARERACAEKSVRGWFGGLAKHRALKVSAVRAQTVRPDLPRSYRGDWTYRAAELQMALLLEYSPPARRTAVSYSASVAQAIAVPVYLEVGAIAYGRALITLTTVSVARPYFRESRRYLESALLARAETWEG